MMSPREHGGLRQPYLLQYLVQLLLRLELLFARLRIYVGLRGELRVCMEQRFGLYEALAHARTLVPACS